MSQYPVGIHSIEPDGTIIYMPDDRGVFYGENPDVLEALKWKRYHNESNFDRRRIEPIYEYDDEIDPEGCWG